MKGAIASVELFAWAPADSASLSATVSVFAVVGGDTEAVNPRRLTLVVGTPALSSEGSGSGWSCRVALADLKRPVEVIAVDSVGALSAALAQAEAWLGELRGVGIVFTRDRAGNEPYF